MSAPGVDPSGDPGVEPAGGTTAGGVLDALRSLERLPGVAEIQDRARGACTDLRWHQALRRRGAEAAAESRVRGAQASAALEGAALDVSVVRELVVGARPWASGADPVQDMVRGAVQATAESDRLAAVLSGAPLQALARLHVAAAAPLLTPDQLGRPRRDDEPCRELADLGSPVGASTVPVALAGVVDLVLAAPGSALVAAAVVHAELLLLRPFVTANGLVARALERALMRTSGLDPTGVVVVESGHLRQGGTAYRGALAAYASGTREGVAMWVVHCGMAVVLGAEEGSRVADAVLAGRPG